MITVLKGFIYKFYIGISNIATLSANNSGQYQPSSQTGTGSARHSPKPQTNKMHKRILFLHFSIKKLRLTAIITI